MTQGSESSRSDRSTSDTASDTTVDTTATATVLGLFEARVREAPGAPAVVAGSDGLDYGRLDARANRLAHHLLDAGLPAGALVAVATARQTEVVVAVLAVLKAGACYTVIDADTPRTGRRQLAAVRPFALLAHAAQQAALDDGSGLRVIRLGAEADRIADRPAGPPASRPDPDRTAVVLFTGGPAPRAVRIGHRRLLAAHRGWAEVARPGPRDHHLITAGSAATAFAAGWTRALCSGGALVLPEQGPWQPEAVRHTVGAGRATVVHTDPGGVHGLLSTAPAPALPVRADAPSVPAARAEEPAGPAALRLVAVTGDRLYLDEQVALQRRLRTGVRLLNVYGPTETAGVGTWFELPQLPGPVDDTDHPSLLGTPFPGCRVELRDGEIHLTPPDGGDPIATGDLGVRRADGLLEFGGRIRDRITLDGAVFDPFRLESVIRGHAGIGSVIVAAVPGFQGARRLVAYTAPPPPRRGRPPTAPACPTWTNCATTSTGGCPARSGRARWCGCGPCPATAPATRTARPCPGRRSRSAGPPGAGRPGAAPSTPRRPAAATSGAPSRSSAAYRWCWASWPWRSPTPCGRARRT